VWAWQQIREVERRRLVERGQDRAFPFPVPSAHEIGAPRIAMRSMCGARVVSKTNAVFLLERGGLRAWRGMRAAG